MKTFILGLSLIFIPLFSGCLEITGTTIVSEDGTMERTFTIEGDSDKVHAKTSIIPIDDNWKRTITKDRNGKFVLMAKRSFASTAEMNAAMRGEEGRTLQISVSLEKHFRWFFSTLHYSETCKTFRQLRTVPLKTWITPEEMSLMTKHVLDKEPFEKASDSVSVDRIYKRFEEWEERNLFEAFFKVILDGARSTGNESLRVADLLRMKDSLYACSQLYVREQNMEKIIGVFSDHFGKYAVQSALDANSLGMDTLKKKLDFQTSVGSNAYTVKLVMPGFITATNASSLEGTTATWKNVISRSSIADFEMWAEARVVNWWAIIVTGGVVLGALVFFVVGVFRRKTIV